MVTEDRNENQYSDFLFVEEAVAREQYFNRDQLLCRGWRESQMRRILGEKDAVGTSPKQSWKQVALYRRERVEAAEGPAGVVPRKPFPGYPPRMIEDDAMTVTRSEAARILGCDEHEVAGLLFDCIAGPFDKGEAPVWYRPWVEAAERKGLAALRLRQEARLEAQAQLEQQQRRAAKERRQSPMQPGREARLVLDPVEADPRRPAPRPEPLDPIRRLSTGRGIYRIRNRRDDWCYIGKAAAIRARAHHHREALREDRHHCEPLQIAWHRDGEDSFVFEVVEELHAGRSELAGREKHWIRHYDQLGIAYNVNGTARAARVPRG